MLDQPVPNPLAKNSNFFTHKVFAAIGLILIGTIIAVAGIWYFVQSAQDKAGTTDDTTVTKVATIPTKTATPSATKDETANWKIYTNARDGYSIRYPTEWVLIPEKTSDGPYFRNFDPTSKPAEDAANGINYPKGYFNLRIIKDSKESGAFGDYSVKDWYDKLGTSSEVVAPTSQYYVKGTFADYKVNGISAKKVKDKFDETDEVILLLKDPNIYEFILYPYGATQDKTIQLMLSTFKLL